MAKYIVQMRRGTERQWIDSNIVPLAGEIVVEIDNTNNLHKLKIGDGIHSYEELAYLMAGDEIVSQVLNKTAPRVVTITLSLDWNEVVCETDPNLGYYSQTINIEGVTKYSKLDLQPDPDMLAEFKQLGLVFVTENKSGIITVYSIGNMPTKSYTMQATIIETELITEKDNVIGIPIGSPVLQSDWEQTDETKSDYIKNKPDLMNIDGSQLKAGSVSIGKLTPFLFSDGVKMENSEDILWVKEFNTLNVTYTPHVQKVYEVSDMFPKMIPTNQAVIDYVEAVKSEIIGDLEYISGIIDETEDLVNGGESGDEENNENLGELLIDLGEIDFIYDSESQAGGFIVPESTFTLSEGQIYNIKIDDDVYKVYCNESGNVDSTDIRNTPVLDHILYDGNHIVQIYPVDDITGPHKVAIYTALAETPKYRFLIYTKIVDGVEYGKVEFASNEYEFDSMHVTLSVTDEDGNTYTHTGSYHGTTYVPGFKEAQRFTYNSDQNFFDAISNGKTITIVATDTDEPEKTYIFESPDFEFTSPDGVHFYGYGDEFFITRDELQDLINY